jgi:uncharacterized Zn-finger protein
MVCRVVVVSSPKNRSNHPNWRRHRRRRHTLPALLHIQTLPLQTLPPVNAPMPMRLVPLPEPCADARIPNTVPRICTTPNKKNSNHPQHFVPMAENAAAVSWQHNLHHAIPRSTSCTKISVAFVHPNFMVLIAKYSGTRDHPPSPLFQEETTTTTTTRLILFRCSSKTNWTRRKVVGRRKMARTFLPK